MSEKRNAEKPSIRIEKLEPHQAPGFIWKPPSGA
jgi:hypothetical protein